MRYCSIAPGLSKPSQHRAAHPSLPPASQKTATGGFSRAWRADVPTHGTPPPPPPGQGRGRSRPQNPPALGPLAGLRPLPALPGAARGGGPPWRCPRNPHSSARLRACLSAHALKGNGPVPESRCSRLSWSWTLSTINHCSKNSKTVKLLEVPCGLAVVLVDLLCLTKHKTNVYRISYRILR